MDNNKQIKLLFYYVLRFSIVLQLWLVEKYKKTRRNLRKKINMKLLYFVFNTDIFPQKHQNCIFRKSTCFYPSHIQTLWADIFSVSKNRLFSCHHRSTLFEIRFFTAPGYNCPQFHGKSSPILVSNNKYFTMFSQVFTGISPTKRIITTRPQRLRWRSPSSTF